jgi:coproporphyrinogen III oxidase-like Fe-S oxidoreductase
MRTSDNPSSAFKINSEADTTLLRTLVSCDWETLFQSPHKNFPIALNLYFPKKINPDYSQLLTREISIYTHKLGERKACKTWFRGTPLKSLSSAEITELTFLTATHFQMAAGNYNEYGFECTVSDITENNLALMKGLHFTTLRLNIDISLSPKNTEIFSAFEMIKQYKFHECHYRLSAENISRSNIFYWLDCLVKSHADIIEIIGIGKVRNCAAKLNEITETMSRDGYILIGNRFFVKNNHPLVQLKQQGKLQYTPPWGASHPDIKDWVGLGVGAIGRVGNTYYQNLGSEIEYVTALCQGTLPICCSGYHPNKSSERQWELVEQLICLHKVSLPTYKSPNTSVNKTEEILKKACKKGWMAKQGAEFIMKSQGIDHIQEICIDLQF